MDNENNQQTPQIPQTPPQPVEPQPVQPLQPVQPTVPVQPVSELANTKKPKTGLIVIIVVILALVAAGVFFIFFGNNVFNKGNENNNPTAASITKDGETVRYKYGKIESVTDGYATFEEVGTKVALAYVFDKDGNDIRHLVCGYVDDDYICLTGGKEYYEENIEILKKINRECSFNSIKSSYSCDIYISGFYESGASTYDSGVVAINGPGEDGGWCSIPLANVSDPHCFTIYKFE